MSLHRTYIKKSLGSKIFDTINIMILLLVVIVTFYPLYYILIYAINDPIDASRGSLVFLPRVLSLEPIKSIFINNDVLTPLLVTIARTVTGTVMHVFSCFVIGYCLAKKDLVFRGFFTKFIVITMYFSAGVIPIYMVMKSLFLTNNFLAYVLPHMAGAYNVMLIKTYIEQIPSSILESADVDGASELAKMWKIVFPLTTPIIATVSLFHGVWQWNEWYDNYIYNSRNPMLQTLQYKLVLMIREQDAIVQAAREGAEVVSKMTPQSLRMAIAAIVTIPIFISFIFVQKYFIKGIMLGSVKG